MTSPEMFRLGMRRLAAGVCLITTRHDGVSYGLIATSVVSVTGEPPTLLACVNRSSSAHDPLALSRFFCVNVLAGAQRDQALIFSSSPLRAQRFQSGTWTTLETGAPVLEDSLAAFDCQVAEAMVHGTHTIFIGTILKVRLWNTALEPLLYVDGQYRRVGEITDSAA